MIVVDSSAVIAIARQEPDALPFAVRIDEDGEPAISVASVFECSIVLRTAATISDPDAERWLDRFLADGHFKLCPVSVEHLAIAREAHIRFGKGTGHGAALNFGDCFSYALAKALDVPLLYKGSDFARTDVVPALA